MASSSVVTLTESGLGGRQLKFVTVAREVVWPGERAKALESDGPGFEF